jgi:hypothetical protein
MRKSSNAAAVTQTSSPSSPGDSGRSCASPGADIAAILHAYQIQRAVVGYSANLINERIAAATAELDERRYATYREEL